MKKRTRLIVAGLVIAMCGYVALMFRPPKIEDVVLPDGTKVIFHSASRGVLTGTSGSLPTFSHPSPDQPGKFRVLWMALYQKLPDMLQSKLPSGQRPPSGFPDGPTLHELELRFQIIGSLRERPLWDIGIADDNGWETMVPNYFTVDREDSTGPGVTGWLRLGSAYPRHSKKLRICFHPAPLSHPELTAEQRCKAMAELSMDNPFYEGPAPPAAAKAPQTKRFRDGEVTLERLTRGPLVSGDFSDLKAVLHLHSGAKEFGTGYHIYDFMVTDSSGQWFRTFSVSSSTYQGQRTFNLTTAPWSDDPCWTVRFEIARDDSLISSRKEDSYVFDHLPVPSDENTPVDRTLTKKGVTLHISQLERVGNDYTMGIEGPGLNNWRDRRIVIAEARDDQGRDYVTVEPGTKERLISGPMGWNAQGPIYYLHLPQDARWWDLSLIVENRETIEFKVQPELVR